MVQQLIFILRDLQDLPVEEVCRITGFKPDKVKANLFHARKFMREKLIQGGYL
jgi:RNA polymerase sigma-70 factor (ECF subfamily)